MREPYEIYVEMYGKIKSGGKVEPGDFSEFDGQKNEEYDERRKLAVSLAAEDAKNRYSMRTKSEFGEEINRLQS